MKKNKKIALKVYFDEETGDADVLEFTKRFEEEGPLFRLDVIKDIIESLKYIYNYEHDKFFNKYRDIGEA